MARVLVVDVDDDEDTRALVRNFLAHDDEDHEVMVAKDAFDAIEILEAHRVDLALIDINMPHTNGFQLVTSLKASLRFKFLPIAFFSSRNSARDISRAGQMKVDGYIVKPIKREGFLKQIKKLLLLKPNRDQITLNIAKSPESSALLKIECPVKIESVSELGMILISDKNIAQDDDIVKVESSVYEKMGIDAIPLKVIAVKEIPKENEHDKQLWKVCLMYKNANVESLQRIKVWISQQIQGNVLLK